MKFVVRLRTNKKMNTDKTQHLQNQINAAIEEKTPLQIVGGNSKAFYGNKIVATDIHTSEHSGVISYEPTELVITARSGTRLTEIEA